MSGIKIISYPSSSLYLFIYLFIFFFFWNTWNIGSVESFRIYVHVREKEIWLANTFRFYWRKLHALLTTTDLFVN